MKILYFTATGNSLSIAKSFDGELLSIPKLIKEGVTEIEDDVIGIITPTYIADAPKMVASFLRNTRIKAGYLFGICTYGFEAGGMVGHMQSCAGEGGYAFDYLNTIIMVDTALERFETGKQIQTLPMKNVKNQIEMITADIRSRRKYVPGIGFKSRMADLAYHAFGKNTISSDRTDDFTISGSCIRCGICAKVCPADNIIIGDRPEFLGKCEGCLGCLHNCPRKAIHLKREKSDVRFRNEEIELKEIIASNE